MAFSVNFGWHINNSVISKCHSYYIEIKIDATYLCAEAAEEEKNKLHLEISTLAAGEAIAIYAARLTTHNKKKMGEFL